MKLFARYQAYIGLITVFTAWHRIAGVKSHHSFNHVLCHPEFLPTPRQIQIWPPRWPPQTAAARNAPGGSSEITLFKMKAADYCVFQS